MASYATPIRSNGKWFTILLAGGPADRARELRDKLAKTRGVMVKYHWEWKKNRTFRDRLPKDVDFVIGLVDMMGHSEYDKLKATCKRAGVRLISTKQNWTNISACLHNYGIHAVEPLPVEVTSTAFLREEDIELKTARVEPNEILGLPVFDEVKAHSNILEFPGAIGAAADLVFSETATPPKLPAKQVSPEMVGLIVQLQQMLATNGVDTLMLTPTEINISLYKAQQ